VKSQEKEGEIAMIHKEPRDHTKKAEMPKIFQMPSKPVQKLDVVLKTDSMGTREAIVSAIEALNFPDLEVEVHSDIGHISKSDLFLAEAGSRLVIGFNVNLLPKVKDLAKERQIEVRLYSVIYNLLEDLKGIARSLTLPLEEKERILSRAKVIALFPSGRDAIILGCEVIEGSLALGQKFRVISDPGIVHTGSVESLHIEKDAVTEATVGQQVGLKVSGFKRGRIGDLVESFETGRPRTSARWRPRPGVFPH
jgi:translation initiation factor IF-2